MWTIKTTDGFDNWFSALCATERACVLASLLVLREKGPGLPRPYADISPSIHTEPALCFVLVTSSVMKNAFIIR